MAVIGVRYAYFEGKSCGKVASVSVSPVRTQLSALQQYKCVMTGATVSFVSLGNYDTSIFETSGAFRWCNVEIENGTKTYKVYEVPNVVLHSPDISGTTMQESPDFTTYSISGQSWFCNEISSIEASTEADALNYAINGWEG